jgi:predicted enzyme related to lactoylglutathione lyase
MELLVNIDVDDLDQAVRFYGAALGLTVSRRVGEGIVELGGAAAPIYLLARPSGSRAALSVTQSRDYLRHWTPVHLDFAVDDIVAATKRAVGAGAAQEGGIERHAWGDIAHLADPFGHGFCLIQFRGRGYDEIASAETGKPIE